MMKVIAWKDSPLVFTILEYFTPAGVHVLRTTESGRFMLNEFEKRFK